MSFKRRWWKKKSLHFIADLFIYTDLDHREGISSIFIRWLNVVGNEMFDFQ